jgi:hypothetical protein
MNERAEYFAILAAMCVTDESIVPSIVADRAYAIWAAANRIAIEAGFNEKVPV